MTDRHAGYRSSSLSPRPRGQALVLFALFLLVLLGASAVAIDYANWLLTDRRLQNVADHAALAGAAMFDQSSQQPSCGSNPALCNDARAQAWESLNQDLGLSLSNATVSCLALRDTPVAGYKDASDSPDSCTAASFNGHTLWVSTPPPNNTSYTGVGGRYALNNAVVFARVNEPTRSFFAGVFGIVARDRIGWATAGPLPTDFALQLFCRNGIAPQSGACGGSGATSLVIDGQGGIQLLRGDIGSNESLKVTATNGGGVILNSGRMFLVNGTCSSALWRCPNGPPSLGGLSDGAPNYNGQNAFLMPPQPVPHYASPLDDVTVHDQDCTGANATHLCVPYRPWNASPRQNAPGDWACDPSGTFGSNNLCGTPVVSGSHVRCDADIPAGVTPSTHLLPSKSLDVNQVNGNPINNPSRNLYMNIDDDPEAIPPQGDSANPPPASPIDYIYTPDMTKGTPKSFTVALRPPFGRPQVGLTSIRFVAFRTSGGVPDTTGTGNPVNLTVQLFVSGNASPLGTWTENNLPVTPTRFNPDDPASPGYDPSLQISLPTTTNFNALSLKFTFLTPDPPGGTVKRGGAVAWAEIQTPTLDPALPPMIAPGYYHSITVAPGGCAIMDPTAQYYGYTYPSLELFQKAGIYQFGGGSDAEINIGAGGFLIGDGVTLVFDPDFPNPTGGRGIVLGAGSALVLNTMLVPGQPPCTADSEAGLYNPSHPLYDPSRTPIDDAYGLPYSSVCAAWAVDSTSHTGLHSGTMLWTGIDPATNAAVPYCADDTLAQCISRGRYGAAALPAQYRGITFFFSTNNWPATTIRGRFQMSAGGGSCDGSQPGIAFRGVLYAPYDDVVITAGSNFGTVGQILAWTAKFNGACPNLVLDYPYQSNPAPPYLLEPGLGQ